MKEISIFFYSDGIKLVGTIYLPKNYQGQKRLPAIIVNSGYTGLNAVYPRLFAQVFTMADYAVLGFDYRGLGESEGPRGRIILSEQIRDIQHAITFFQQQRMVNPDKIGILGWGMGGGLVIDVAVHNNSVKCVAAINGFFDGKAFYKTVFPKYRFIFLQKKIEKDKIRRVLTGELMYIDSFSVYPLSPDAKRMVYEKLMPFKHYQTKVSFEIAESIMNFNSLKLVNELKCPLFVAHGKYNRLHPISQSRLLFEKADVPKKFYLIEGRHNDFMDIEHPSFQKLSNTLISWFDNILKR